MEGLCRIMESVKLLSFTIYVSVSLQGGNVYATCRHDLDKCDTILEGQFFSRMLKEVSPIGTEVYSLPTLSDNLFHHFFIEDSTNKDERFSVSDNGTVYLSGYLDYDIDQNYTLSVLCYDGTNTTADSVCVRHMVEVNVIDDAHWPRPFNETCCACQKAKSRPKDYSINNLPTHLQKKVWFLSRRDHRFVQVYFSDDVYRLVRQVEPIFSCDGALPGRDYVYTLTWGIRILGCPEGYYGIDCSEHCICKNGATCHALIGSCMCAPGWQGPACDIRRSEVVLNATELRVYTGDYIEMQANIYNIKLINTSISWYLNGSDEFLNDTKHFTSTFNTRLNITHLTISNFKDDFAGVYVCSVIDSSGNNITATKTLSAKGCHNNYFGENCDLLCSCENGAECDRYRGCICQAGWMGTYCDSGI
ncbi:uncharacterized protein [Ptychodera flava]|uniref:uncharacterized protein n=1 Tax=Ptychodera flava TaxID=63121 RepID=UPI00396A0001